MSRERSGLPVPEITRVLRKPVFYISGIPIPACCPNQSTKIQIAWIWLRNTDWKALILTKNGMDAPISLNNPGIARAYRSSVPKYCPCPYSTFRAYTCPPITSIFHAQPSPKCKFFQTEWFLSCCFYPFLLMREYFWLIFSTCWFFGPKWTQWSVKSVARWNGWGDLARGPTHVSLDCHYYGNSRLP